MTDPKIPHYDLWVIEHIQVPCAQAGGPYSSIHVVLIKDCNSCQVILVKPFYHFGADEVIVSLQSAIDSAGRSPGHIYIDGPLCLSKKLEGFCIATGILILIYPPSGMNWYISEYRLGVFRKRITSLSKELGTMSLYYLEHILPDIWNQVPRRPVPATSVPRKKEVHP